MTDQSTAEIVAAKSYAEDLERQLTILQDTVLKMHREYGDLARERVRLQKALANADRQLAFYRRQTSMFASQTRAA